MPLPNVAPTIVAARAIPNKISADILVDYQLEILRGLIGEKIQVVSSASDGSAIERSMQHKLSAVANRTREYRIRHPKPTNPANPDITTSIPMFNGQPVVMVQDAKHAAKTARNNLMTGAKLLTLGNYTAMYSQVRKAAFAPDGPLYHRDVEKVDRQDDNAACRLLSASALKWFITHEDSGTSNDEARGLIVFLFLMGELVDAYQSRTLPHVERVKMVLRLHFFLERWAQFLDCAGYPKGTYFISGQFRDILDHLIFGLIQLVVVYRDTYGSRFPLLLWLHSTEVCEHVFGVLRSLVMDFTFLDFLNLVLKIFIRLRIFTKSTLATVGKDTASGYAHTYSDCRGIDLTALSTFPTDEEINEAARFAFEEAEDLLFTLGISPDVVSQSKTTPPTTVPAMQEDIELQDLDEDSVEALDETDKVGYLYECAEQLKASSLSSTRKKKLKDLSYASITLHAHKDMTM